MVARTQQEISTVTTTDSMRNSLVDDVVGGRRVNDGGVADDGGVSVVHIVELLSGAVVEAHFAGKSSVEVSFGHV